MSGRWVDLREAAELLGTSTEAVGKRAVGESLRAEEIQRRDLIIRQLTQANAALAARVPELEAPQTSEGWYSRACGGCDRATKLGRGGCYGPSERIRARPVVAQTSRGSAEGDRILCAWKTKEGECPV